MSQTVLTDKFKRYSLVVVMLHLMKLIFFSEKSFKWIYNNKYITVNLLSFYLLMFLIPMRSPLGNKIYFLDVAYIAEGFLLSSFYLFIIYVLIPSRKPHFVAYLRVFFSIEVINVAAFLTLFLHGYILKISYSVLIGWYITLSVFAVSKMSGHNYIRSIAIVVIAFVFTNILPVLFVG
jgi:hypothetical protein